MTIAYVSDTGKKELYHEMLQECFGFSLSHLNKWNSSRMVCTLCIAQLKLACAFKNQVQQSERHFNFYYNTQTNRHPIKNVEECEKPGITEELSGKNNVAIKLEDDKPMFIPLLRDEERPLLKPNRPQRGMRKRKKTSKRAREKRTEESKLITEYDSDTPIAKLAELISCQAKRDIETVATNGESGQRDNGPINRAKVEAAGQPETENPKHVSERRRVRVTCLAVLRETTACPFRHHRSWFRCFFCAQDFMRMVLLREHTFNAHADLVGELGRLKRYPRSLQIDITDLECRRCGSKMADVGAMRDHLSQEHGTTVHVECIADYKVDGSPYVCHVCGDQFHVFRTLTTHLNVHRANCICDVCGRPFLNGKRLAVHRRSHQTGSYPCPECGKVLPTKTSRSNHVESAHSKRALRCHVCGEPMRHYNARIKHMSEAHQITHVFRCTVCGREYNVRHYLATHMRQAHGAKDKKCELCGAAFVTGHGLKKHMRRHTGDRPFQCPVCRKAYARGSTLKEHMRAHHAERPARS
ncbi:unnamed protein product, partial [Iphiclides podalirius]